jgi:hypothetical protein
VQACGKERNGQTRIEVATSMSRDRKRDTSNSDDQNLLCGTMRTPKLRILTLEACTVGIFTHFTPRRALRVHAVYVTAPRRNFLDVRLWGPRRMNMVHETNMEWTNMRCAFHTLQKWVADTKAHAEWGRKQPKSLLQVRQQQPKCM